MLLDTIAACGDDARGVMCDGRPAEFRGRTAKSPSCRSSSAITSSRTCAPITRSGTARSAWRRRSDEEPFYGPTYLPRKFKIGFVVPPSNDIDVYTQDLGFIAVAGPNGVEGFNVTIGGGMGRTDNEPTTYPRLADVIGYIPKERLLEAAGRGDRRCSATTAIAPSAPALASNIPIDDKGLDFIKAEIERRMGAPFEPARPFEFDHQRRQLRLARDRRRPVQLRALHPERPRLGPHWS